MNACCIGCSRSPDGQPLDSGNLVALVRHRQTQAGIHAAAVYQHRTRSALSVIAAFFGAGHLKVLAQEIQ